MCFANIFCLPWERQCCTSLEAREDGDKRYLGNEVDSQRVDYDVTCLDRNYCFTSVSVSGSGADSVFLVMGFVFPFRRVVFQFRVLGFRFCLYASS